MEIVPSSQRPHPWRQETFLSVPLRSPIDYGYLYTAGASYMLKS